MTSSGRPTARSFRNGFVGRESALNLSGSQTMARHVENVVDAADDPEVAVLIAPGAVSGGIEALEFAPVLFPVAGLVAVNGAEHGGPRLADNKLPALIRSHFLAVIVNHGRINAKNGSVAVPGFSGRGARQRADHLHSGFRLPPGVNDRAAASADMIVIPHPCLGIDRFAYRPQQPERREVVLGRPFVSPFNESSDGGGSRIENRHAMFRDDAPEAVRLGPVWRAFIHEVVAPLASGP